MFITDASRVMATVSSHSKRIGDAASITCQSLMCRARRARDRHRRRPRPICPGNGAPVAGDRGPEMEELSSIHDVDSRLAIFASATLGYARLLLASTVEGS